MEEYDPVEMAELIQSVESNRTLQYLALPPLRRMMAASIVRAPVSRSLLQYRENSKSYDSEIVWKQQPRLSPWLNPTVRAMKQNQRILHNWQRMAPVIACLRACRDDRMRIYSTSILALVPVIHKYLC